MKLLDQQLAEVIKIDPLAAAEEMTGATVDDGGIGFAAWWDRADEVAFPDWQTDGVPA